MKPLSKQYLETHLPPTVDAEKSHAVVSAVFGICAVLAFLVPLAKYCGCYNSLFYYRDGVKLLREGMMMVSFRKILKPVCLFLFWELFFAVGYSQQLYASLFAPSKSIYTLRRLPDGGKTLRRMVADVPLCWAACTAALGCAYGAFFYLIWRFVTPAGCLPY